MSVQCIGLSYTLKLFKFVIIALDNPCVIPDVFIEYNSSMLIFIDFIKSVHLILRM